MTTPNGTPTFENTFQMKPNKDFGVQLRCIREINK